MREEASADDQERTDARRTSRLRMTDVPGEIPQEVPIAVGIRSPHIGDLGTKTDSRRHVDTGGAADYRVLDRGVVGEPGVARKDLNR
jgi:hypothetical protein